MWPWVVSASKSGAASPMRIAIDSSLPGSRRSPFACAANIELCPRARQGERENIFVFSRSYRPSLSVGSAFRANRGVRSAQPDGCGLDGEEQKQRRKSEGECHTLPRPGQPGDEEEADEGDHARHHWREHRVVEEAEQCGHGLAPSQSCRGPESWTQRFPAGCPDSED